MAGSTKKITQKALHNLLVGKSIWDSEVKGFGVRATKHGYSFIFKRTVNGTQRLMTIGRLGDITVADARKEAQKLAGQVAAGQDPSEAKRTMSDAPTVEELANEFVKRCEKQLKPGTVAGYRISRDTHVAPALGRRKALNVKQRDVAALHTAVAEIPEPEKGPKKGGPIAANRVLAFVSAMYEWGASQELIPKHHPNPAKGVERYREKGNERFLSPDEIERLSATLALLDTEGLTWEREDWKRHTMAPNAPAVAAIRLLMLTGCRLREILSLRWEEVRFDLGALDLKDSKTGSKVVALSDAAVTLLEELEEKATRSPYVFPSTTDPKKPRRDLKKPWEAITAHADLGGLRLHDLRHTFAATGVGLNLSLKAIGGLLGHSNEGTTGRYAHLQLHHQRAAANTVAGPIADALGISITK
ncbi:MAG: site-specific integrase [Maricaulis sp.]|uniref:tyrosine-type recombinase/integrase n=1 Tax=Maricaulis sp. TaxID=1486257 RepID=UPI002635CFC3|nr:site-specific integrase [Maricaulis sp.]MDM7983251.1 site-specific integrase [Maricaulis sp.]